MDKLYIATSSLNLNSILSTESISPEAFYSKRDFGYKRYTKVAPNPFSNSIIAYDKIPDFQIEETDFDEYPLIIEISKDLIKNESISCFFEKKGVKIFQLKNTIYLHAANVRFLFFNEKDKNTTLIKMEPSIETKLLPVYQKGISLITNQENLFKWDRLLISNLSDLPSNEISKQIKLDSKTNKLKGFYYSYLLGIILSSSIKEKTLKEEFALISQLIEEFFNLKEKQSTLYQNITDRLERLKLSIENADGNKRVPKEELVKAKYLDDSDISEQSKVLDLLKTLKPEKESFFQQLENKIEESENDLLILIDDLKAFLKKPYSRSILSIKTRRITKYISELRQKKKEALDPLFLIENLNFNGYKITQLKDTFFEKDNADLFRNIVNDILDYPIYNIQTFQEEKINLAFEIGKILKEYISNWENSRERDYFNSLMDNIENYQPFDLKSHPSILLQSIALLIQKGEEVEKLIDNLIKNQLSDYRIALGLWGSIFGFSALPKTITNLLFEKENIESTRRVYKDAQAKLHNFNSEVSLDIESVVKQPVKQKDEAVSTRYTGKQSVTKTQSNTDKKKLILEQKPIKTQESIESPKCPKCGADMVLRKGKYGEFYGCSKYGWDKESSCDGTIQLKDIKPTNALKSDYKEMILKYVETNGHCKISEMIKSLKSHSDYSYNVENTVNYIKQNLSDKLDLENIGRASGVKIRNKGFL